jgi:hypothetical protein
VLVGVEIEDLGVWVGVRVEVGGDEVRVGVTVAEGVVVEVAVGSDV